MEILTTVLIVALMVGSVKTGNTTEVKVPEIEGCRYLDAYSVDCWWQRPKHDKNTQFRLSYTRYSDPIALKQFHNCEPTLRTVNSNGDVIEHCEIIDGARPYSRFKIFITVNCDHNTSCSNASSNPIDFVCDPENVLLHVPPRNFQYELSSRQLTWAQPDRENSLLTFVLKIAKTARYKLVFTEWTGREANHSINNWKVWYLGNATSFYLPTLVPGAHYETKVYAALVNKGDTPGNEVWGPPSNTIKFTAPRMHVKDVERDETTESSRIPRTTTGSGTVVPPQVAQNSLTTTIAVSSTLLFIVALASILAYYLVYKKYCCCCANRVKIPTPILMVEMEELAPMDVYQGDTDSVTDVPDQLPITSLLVHKHMGNFSNGDGIHHYSNQHQAVGIHIENEIHHDNRGRQRGAMAPGNDVNEPDDVINNDSNDETKDIDPNDNPPGRSRHQVVNFRPHALASGDVYGELPTNPTSNGFTVGHHGASGSISTHRGGGKDIKLNIGHLTSSSVTHNRSKNCETNPSYATSELSSSCSHGMQQPFSEGEQSMDYIAEGSLHSPSKMGEKYLQWSDHMHSKKPSLPDYVKQGFGVSIAHPSNLDLYLASGQGIPLKTVYCNDDTFTRHCRCSSSLGSGEKALQLLLKAACPVCQSPVRLLFDEEKDEVSMRESSPSRNSVDSGYSPDSPMTL